MDPRAETISAPAPHPLLPWFAAVLSGVLAFLGYAGFDQFYLEWVCLVPLLWAIDGQPPRRAFLIGWVAGIVGHGGGFSWIATMLRQFAAAPWPLAILGLLLLAAANGLVFAVWAGTVRLIGRDAGWSSAWGAPVVWTAAEKFWPQLFPNYLGASQYRLPLVTQVADVTGILGVTFLVIYANATAYAAVDRLRRGQRAPWRQIAVFAVVVTAVLAYGAVRISAVDRAASQADSLRVGLVQTNRGAGDKHADAALFLREHQEMSRELVKRQPLDLVVWPESIVGIALAGREGVLPTGLLGDVRTPVLFGAIVRTTELSGKRSYNSAVLADADGRIAGIYDKMVLVPFGEYIPFGDVFPFFYRWSPYSGRFWQGENSEPLRLNGRLLSVNICYEDIFPGHVRMLMQGGRDRRTPEVLFNVTNDSWYGDTVQPLEHLALASFRSIEHRRALVRSTNTGISAIVDPVGRIVQRTAQWQRETLTVTVPLMQGRTVYGVLGDWLGWVCLSVTVAGLVRGWGMRRASGAGAPARKEGRGASGRRTRKRR